MKSSLERTAFLAFYVTHWPMEDVFKDVISKHSLRIKFMTTSYEITLRWMPQTNVDG